MLISTRRVFVLLACACCLGGFAPAHAGISGPVGSVSAGFDLYQLTEPLFLESVPGGPPPGFFEPIGVFNDIDVVGNPISQFDFGSGPEDIGLTDLIVRRTRDTSGPFDTVPIEIVALSLRSLDPIDVGGGVTDHVYIGLDPNTPSDGQYAFEFDEGNDEFFAGVVGVTFNVNFETRVGAPDGALLNTGSVQLNSSFGAIPFSNFPEGLSPFSAPDLLIQDVNFLLDGTQDTDFFQSFTPLLLENFDDNGDGPGDFSFYELAFENANRDDPGDTPDNPVLPDGQQGDSFIFNDAPGEGWFDPPATNAYQFKTDGASSFTGVSLPNTFVVPDGDGQYVVTSVFGDTTVFAGSGITFPAPVTWFNVSGIDPSVDGGDPLAFPTFLQFDSNSNTFTMTPVPEPATCLLVAGVLAANAAARRLG